MVRTAGLRLPKLIGALLISTSFLSPTLLIKTGAAETFQVTNPLISKRADPYIYRHTDGYYYFTATVPEYDRIELRRATTLAGLPSATGAVIWTHHGSGPMATHIWAPELHYIDAKWYIYFAAGSSTNTWDIRIYVLENSAAVPLEGTWAEKGQLVTNGTTFALDATTFEHDGTRYLVWAEDDPTLEINTALFIAPMSNPWTLRQAGVRLSVPEYDWEKVGYAVNEGPAVLQRNGKIFLSYSASATDANYCVGLLTASDASDLLKPSSWSKSPNPVLKSGNGVYGPGHNQFTTSPDGAVDLVVFHARDYQNITGDPLNDPNRATRVQVLNWNPDGTPDFGSPVANGTIPVGVDRMDGGAGGVAPGSGGTRPGSDAGPRASGGSAGRGGAPAVGGSATSGGGAGIGGAGGSRRADGGAGGRADGGADGRAGAANSKSGAPNSATGGVLSDRKSEGDKTGSGEIDTGRGGGGCRTAPRGSGTASAFISMFAALILSLIARRRDGGSLRHLTFLTSVAQRNRDRTVQPLYEQLRSAKRSRWERIWALAARP